MAANEVVARNLRRFREERQLSLGELSRRSGLAKQTIASVESSGSNPTVETLERLADALGVSIRALLTELGSEIIVNSGDDIRWQSAGTLSVRHLDQVFGSGYVTNSLLRLESNRGPSHHKPAARGALRHCYVMEGRVRLGPESEMVGAVAGDFIRFPADAAHVFEAITPIATVFVCTTSPQRTMVRGERAF